MSAIAEIKIGLLGVGSIGGYVARTLMKGDVPGARLVAVADPQIPPEPLFSQIREAGVALVDSFENLANYDPALVVECANQKLVRQSAAFFLRQGVDLVIMSIGALVDGDFLAQLDELARVNHARIYLPSGAVGALDALRAARVEGLEEVTLTTSKPPKGLAGVTGLDLSDLEGPKVVYEGWATEAVSKFPKNVNVAAAISLAGLGPHRTRVRVVADPELDSNVHEISAKGAFGAFQIKFINRPSPENPRTSYLACLSVVALLQRITSSVQVGN